MTLGDFNGDGTLDVLLANQRAPSQVAFNDGTGDFTLGTDLIGSGFDTRSVATGDLNGDGALDLVLANWWAPSQIYRHTETGSFTSHDLPGSGGSGTTDVALGDLNGDGRLDVVLTKRWAASQIYLQTASGGFGNPISLSGSRFRVTSVAIGDLNDDGALDIVLANENEMSQIYLNDGFGKFPSPTDLLRSYTGGFKNVALGDLNGDGSLDLVLGNVGFASQVYFNDQDGGFSQVTYLPANVENISGVAIADLNQDGRLDLAFANQNIQSYVVFNSGSTPFAYPTPLPNSADGWTRSTAVGDLNGDGILDIVLGKYVAPSQMYLSVPPARGGLSNQPPTLTVKRPGPTAEADFFSTPVILDAPTIPITYTLLDPEGDPVRRVQAYYSLDGGGQWREAKATDDTPTTNLSTTAHYHAQAQTSNWIDITGTGTRITLADEEVAGPFALGFGMPFYDRRAAQFWVSSNGWLALRAPAGAAPDNRCLDQPAVPTDLIAPFWDDLDPSAGGRIFYQQIDHATTVVAFIQVPRHGGGSSYSFEVILRRDGTITFQYQSMSGTLDSATSGVRGRMDRQYTQLSCNTPIAPDAAATQLRVQAQRHIFQWDAFASGVFGKSDRVVVRLVAIPGVRPLPRAIAGPYQHAMVAMTSLPFRIQGTQVRVRDADAAPLAGALVYRLPGDQVRGGLPFRTGNGLPFKTNMQGYLLGRGALAKDDQLVALQPISSTNVYTLYLTSAEPISTGLNLQRVAQPGLQELRITRDYPLLVFNLDISLEWDARNDPQFLSRLERDLQRTAEVLYDWTDGQVALGDLRLFFDRERWNDAHIRIYATNSLRPNAVKGGIVDAKRADPDRSKEYYGPGQVRMGAIWNRYGEATDSLGEDWPRTLAHELGHYALFLEDTYLGYDAERRLITVEGCHSAMSDPYRDDYSEFHPSGAEWQRTCRDTLAEQESGRSDWASILAFYRWPNWGIALRAPTTFDAQPGPSILPLALTRVITMSLSQPLTTMEAPIVPLMTAGGARYLPSPAAQAILFQPDKRRLIDLGKPMLDQVLARGARPGDRLCLYDQRQRQQGCQVLGAVVQPLQVRAQDDWTPELIVTPVTSRSLALEVQNVPTGLTLLGQVFPMTANASQVVTLTATTTTTLGTKGVYSGTITLAEPTFEGYVPYCMT